MKIAFWSGIRKEGGVTGNLAAISTLFANTYHRPIMISSNHVSDTMVQDYFCGNSQYLAGGNKCHYYFCYGEPDYFRTIWSAKDSVKNLAEGIYLQNPPDMLESSLFCERQEDGYLSIMDVAGKRNISSSQALEEADIIVVFLSQDLVQVQSFFEQFSELISKSIFFINNYQSKNICTPAYVSENYGVKRERISVIPHSEGFANACETGRVEEYMKEQMTKETPEDYLFLHSIKKAAQMLYLEMEEYEERQKMDEI